MLTDIFVEIAYATSDKQYIEQVTIHEGASIKMAIQTSSLLKIFKDANLLKNKIGINSKPARLSDIISNGDRIEIYRQLTSKPYKKRD